MVVIRLGPMTLRGNPAVVEVAPPRVSKDSRGGSTARFAVRVGVLLVLFAAQDACVAVSTTRVGHGHEASVGQRGDASGDGDLAGVAEALAEPGRQLLAEGLPESGLRGGGGAVGLRRTAGRERLRETHPEVEVVDDDAEHARLDRCAAGSTDDEHWPAVTDHHGGCHVAPRALAAGGAA